MQKELKVLLTASALFLMAGGLFGPIYAIFVEEIGGDLLTAGGAYASFSIAAGLLVFFMSKWEDRAKHQEKLIILGYAFNALGFFGYLFVDTPLQLFLIEIIFGMGSAIGSPAYDGVYSQHIEKGKFVSGWGLWESMAYIISGISALVGGFLASFYGFKFLFLVMFVLSIIGFVISLFLVYNRKTKWSLIDG